MGAAAHLKIDIAEYDARIRTFIPDYEELIGTAADALGVLGTEAPEIIDLGIGTGALAVRCLEAREAAHLVGVDSDPAMIEIARGQLAGHSQADFVHAEFLDMNLPRCDAIVASLALHHIPTAETKRAFYRSCAGALRQGGVFVSADYFPAREPRLAASQHMTWFNHLRRTYAPAECDSYLAAWAGDDVFFPLQDEFEWLGEARLAPEVLWRRGGLAVIAALRHKR